MATFNHFGVIGGGAWGTALAIALHRAGRRVTLWARNAEVVEAINKEHVNKLYLPHAELNPVIRATASMQDVAACDTWLLVAPAQYTRDMCKQLAALKVDKEIPVVVCAKGIEQNTLMLPGAVAAEVLPHHPVAVLSGPTFASEVAREQATAFTLACRDEALGKSLAQAIGSKAFRPYYSPDIVGAQVGGAIKNILAIACGIVTGYRMGDNARAALVTRGLAEIMRLGVALGGKEETMNGLSGLGDLVLTCSSMQSRNMSLGVALGEGATLQEILGARSSVAEGVFSASAAVALAQKLNVDMPITAAVDAVLNHKAAVADTIADLLARPLKSERA